MRLALSLFVGSLCVLTVAAQEKPTPQKGKKAEPEVKNPKLAALVKKLKDPKAKVRLESVEEIGKMGEGAAEAAKPLCDALLDRSPQVAEAALKALEEVRPDLYKPLSTMLLDIDGTKHEKAIAELGLMDKDATPVLNLLHIRLRRELADGFLPSGGFTSIQKDLFHAIRRIDPDDGLTISHYKAIAAPGTQNVFARQASLVALRVWAGDDEKRRKELIPLAIAGLASDDSVFLVTGSLQSYCIEMLADYGPLAKSALPALKKLKLNSLAEVREAATKAVDKIEKP
jgi:hypothetical protein